MLKGEWKNPYFRLGIIVFAALTVLCFPLVFLGKTLFWRSELNHYRRMLDSELPFEPEKSFESEKNGVASGTAGDVSGELPVMGEAHPLRETKMIWNWKPDKDLRFEALQAFSKNAKPGPAISIAIQLSEEDFGRGERFALVTEFYTAQVAAVHRKENEKLKAVLPESVTELNRMPVIFFPAFLENMRLELLKQRIPEEIVTVLMKALLRELSTVWRQTIASAVLERPARSVVLKYPEEAADYFIEVLSKGFDSGKLTLGALTGALFRELVESARKDAVLNPWLMRELPENRFASLLQSRNVILKYDAFWILPRPVRFLIADAFAHETETVPHSAAVWKKLETVTRNQQERNYFKLLSSERTPDGALLAWFRSSKPWRTAVDRQDYGGALNALNGEFRKLYGQELPDSVVKELTADLETEKRLREELVNEAYWKELYDQLPRQRKILLDGKDIVYLLQRSIVDKDAPPGSGLSLKGRVLIALSLVNRGVELRYAYVGAGLKRNDVWNYISEGSKK